ncbi:MAG: hypothetical protein HYZ02_02305 [Candidatus Levybacteria bacterium]|nr:hypothetical protein [Candidatus Levybacteria bacterium]
MKLAKLWAVFFLFFLFFLFPQKTFAAFSFSIDSTSAGVVSSGDQEVDVNLSIVDLPSESYFRVALQKESGGSYYGYVKNNNGDWVAIQPFSADCSVYYRASDTSIISLQLQFKLGANEIDNGSYNLKAHRFTSTGSCSSTKATNDYAVTVSLSTPTSTPTLVPTNTPVPTATSVPTPTKTPTPAPVKTPTPTPKSGSTSGSGTTSTPVPTKVLAFSSQAAGGSGNINTAVSPTVNLSPTPTKSESTKKPTPTPIKSGQTAVLGVAQSNLSKILIGLGVVFLAACGIMALRSFRKGKKDESDY